MTTARRSVPCKAARATARPLFVLLAVLAVAAPVAAAGAATRAADSAEETRPLGVGATLPEASLRGADGRDFELAAVIRQQPTVLIFYRGGWCPYCNGQLGALKSVEPQLAERGFRLLAISADRPEKLRESEQRHDVAYTLLSDSRMELARALGIAFRVDDATLASYQQWGIDLEDASGETHHELPVPSVFVVGTDGVIRYVYSNPDYKVRLEGDALLSAAEGALAE